jgi:ubiquinone/menaquinone biosynthesis C-methylase UbiE
MSLSLEKNNEQLAEAAFNRQAILFDEQYSNNTIIQYKRERVRQHVQQWIGPGSSILELNSGTGEDAVWFATQGHKVHATDISGEMQSVLRHKVAALGLEEKISTETISFTALENLMDKRTYDMIFSNFAGLNCSQELDKVLNSFSALVKPGGIVTLVVLPKFCLWEFLLLFKGKFRTAFRRLTSNKGAKAHIEGEYFKCWYYNASYICKQLEGQFKILGTEGLCTIVPPSYIEGFAEKYPKIFSNLKAYEAKCKTKWPWRNIGDYYIISLQKNGA